MSQYYRNHPDEPISHDWVSGTIKRRMPLNRKEPAVLAPNGNVDRAITSDPPEPRSDNKQKA